MRGAIIVAIFGATLVASPGAETTGSRPSDSLVRPFSQNGKIRMELSAGEYIISGSKDERIHIRWSVQTRISCPGFMRAPMCAAPTRALPRTAPATTASGSTSSFPIDRISMSG